MIAAWLAGEAAAGARGTVAVLAAWAVAVVPRVPAGVRCWAWRAAFGVVAVSFAWTTPVDVGVRRPSRAVPGPGRPRVATAVEVKPAAPAPGRGRPGLVPREPVWPIVAFTAWAVFVIGYAARLGVGWGRTRHLRAGRPADVPGLADLCRAVGVRRPPAVVANSAVRSPLLVGVWPPTIVLPDPPPGDLRLVLAHELAHLRRRDLLWNWLPTVAFAVLPWHPLVWVGRRHWRLAVESACDAEAVAATSAAVADYGRALVAAATAPPPAGVLAVAAAAGPRWLLERRLAAMANITRWGRGRRVVAGVAIAAAGGAAAVPWRAVAQQPPASRPAAGPAVAVVAVRANPAHVALGQVTIPPAVVVRTLAAGPVVEVRVREGGRVSRGDVLARLDDRAQADAVVSAERIAKTADERLAQVLQMVRAGLTGVTDGSAAQLDADRAHDLVQQRRADLDARRVVASCDGTVGPVAVAVGTTAVAGDVVATLSATAAEPTCEFMVPGDERVTIGRGTAVVVMDRTASAVLGRGQVTAVAAAVDPQTGTVRVTARLTPPAADLWPGQFITVGWDGPATASVATVGTADSSFPFAVPVERGTSQFAAGDQITVTEVRGTGPDMANGIFRISGTYTLASRDTATLAAMVTARDATGGMGAVNAAQSVRVARGSGTFTVLLPISEPGFPHVSFYPASGGGAFGGAYVGTGPSVWRR